MPDLPTIAESGISGYDGNTWNGIVAPAGTPRNLLTRIAQDISRVLQDEDVKVKLLRQGLEPESNSPVDFDRFIAQEVSKWAKVIKSSAARID